MSSPLQSALEMLKRLPAAPESLSAISSFLSPALQAALLSRVSTELVVLQDIEAGLPFLGCSANRVDSSYRSPHTGKLLPEGDDGIELSMSLRKLEIYVNTLFFEYSHSYYPSAISSVYFSHSTDKAGFTAFFALLNGIVHSDSHKGSRQARLSSVHIVEMVHEGNEKKQYQVTSRMVVSLQLETLRTDLTGSFVAYKEEKLPIVDSATEAEGLQLIRLIEDSEMGLRRQVENFVAARMPGIVTGLYSRRPSSEVNAFKGMHDKLMTQLLDSGLKLREADS